MDEASLTIGEVAQQVGLNTSAIRYYESVGVLPKPVRESGQRRYGADTVRRLQVIDVAKRAGFSLEEARVLLATGGNGAGPVSEPLRELARRKLPEVDALIERAAAMRRWLSTATECNCQTIDVCALFDPHTPIAAGKPDLGPVALSITQVAGQ
jgi:MerR family redox-sensitive transcriptional activator SoxR